MNFMNIFYNLKSLIFITLASRTICFFYLGDYSLQNEWLILVHHLSEKGILGYNVVINNYLAVPKLALPNETVLPSVFMPPLYAYYIHLIKIIFSNYINLVNVVLISQIILSSISVVLFYKIINETENKNISLIYSLIFSLIPLNIYSSVQISSVSIQVFLLICFFYFFQKILLNKHNLLDLVNFSIFSGFLILMRGEFIIFFLFSSFYLFIFYKINKKNFVISLVVSSIIISPYLARNLKTFDSIILTKSFGYNLLKGNNPEFKIEGNPEYIEKKFNRKNLQIKTDNYYEINLDNFYKKKSINFIVEDPLFYFENYIKKILAFLFFDPNSTYPNYYNVFHIVPKIFISVMSILGGILALKKKGFYQFLSLYFFLNILFFSIFFILPRYSLILLPAQILLSIKFVNYVLRKFFY